MRHVLIAGAALVLAGHAAAQPAANPVPSPAQTAQGDVAVTIYSNNRALIEDKRSLDLPAGRSRQEFRDVSAQIQPETVTLNARGIQPRRAEFRLRPPQPAGVDAEGTTSDIAETVSPVSVMNAQEVIVTGSRMAAPAPPPPAAMAKRGAYKASEERLGDVRLYRVPIAVTVAAKSQKQIALLRQPAVKVSSILRLRPGTGQLDQPLERVLITRNRTAEGLGLALPAGKVALFGRRGGRRILLGEGRIDDYAVGEKVEIPVASATGVRARQIVVRSTSGGGYRLTLNNDLSRPQSVEIELPLSARATGAQLIKRDGWMLWRVTVPANGTVELTYAI